MLIFNFEKTLLEAIKTKVSETLPALYDYIHYLPYEPAGNELSSLLDDPIDSELELTGYKGAICVFVREIKSETGSVSGTWQTNNYIEIQCYGFDTASNESDGNGGLISHTSSENANIISQALTTASFLALTAKKSIFTNFNTVDNEGETIVIGEKEPLGIKLFEQEDLQESQVAECLRVLLFRFKIEEKTDSDTLGPLLKNLNKQIEANYIT